MDTKLFYLAYGSNLHPIRLTERIPSCKFLEIIRLPNYQIHFHTQGQDGSGKCNAFFTDDPSDQLICAAYSIEYSDKALLDDFEGPNYAINYLNVKINGQQREAFLYIAKPEYINHNLKPLCWYKKLVLHGLQYHTAEQEYFAYVEKIESTKDPNIERKNKNEHILNKIKHHTTRSELKILLLQIRDQPRVKIEEHESFAKYSGLQQEQIHILNVFEQAFFSPDVINGFDALYIGGASEASVLEPDNYPFLLDCQALILYCVEEGIPVFASCFGFQLATIALGGEITRDKQTHEMGTLAIQLTDSAQQDPIFYDTPNPFSAVAVHQEKALTVPAGCEMLAYTDHCCHAFRVIDKPFWAFQFHPEVDKPILVERLTIYKEKYTKDSAHLECVLTEAVDTPESNYLLEKFVERILLQ